MTKLLSMVVFHLKALASSPMTRLPSTVVHHLETVVSDPSVRLLGTILGKPRIIGRVDIALYSKILDEPYAPGVVVISLIQSPGRALHPW